MVTSSTHELLRLVSLRGPRAGLSVDLAPRVADSEVLRRMQDNLELLGRPELVQRVVAQVRQLDEFELAGTSLSTLRAVLGEAQQLTALTVELGDSSALSVKELSQNPEFKRDLRLVYDSWLAQRISGGEGAVLVAHVELLRAAAVVLEWGDRPGVLLEQPLSAWLSSTVIATPRQWAALSRSQAQIPERRADRANAPPRGRNLTASELRSKISTVTTGVEAMRKVENAVVDMQSGWERSQAVILDASTDGTTAPRRRPGTPGPPSVPGPRGSTTEQGASVDEAEVRLAFARKVDAVKGIPEDTRASLKRAIERPGTMNEFFGNLELIATDDNSQLCAEIQAVETAILQELPPAPSRTRPEQPPLISTVGLGDLVVARERLVGYEANEIAHIENVLPGELKKVELERRHRFEEATEEETTTLEESQTDTDITDRASRQKQSQSGMAKSLAVDAGVNVSSKYGPTKIDASLDVQFQKSSTESSSETTEDVQEIITRTVERSREEVRTLRRTLTIDETRSLIQHDIDNTAEGMGGSPSVISGVYRWVEKIQEIELRRYGTRLMVEFHVPEPAVSVLESQARTAPQTTTALPPFDVRPVDLNRQTFMCLAQRYGADLSPPPAEWIDVPFHHASQTNKDANAAGEYVHTALINVPAEYRPVSVSVTVTAPPENAKTDWERPYITVAVGTARQLYAVTDENDVVTEEFFGPVIASLWPSNGALGFVNAHARFEPSAPVEQGVPISMSATEAFDNAFTAQAVIAAKLTDEAWQDWQLGSWRILREAYAERQDQLDRQEREQEINESFGIASTERPTSINRRTERTELKKWAIKAMRYDTFDFHPMVTEDGLQEVDATDAHAQAPVTAFFEQSFEWEQMTYFFYPYYWARRDTWEMRRRQQSVDSTYEAFLQSGAARVIVPVTPGYERRLLCYLNFDGTELADRIPGMDVPCPEDPMNDAADTATPDFYDIGLDILTERHGDLVRGTGSLAIQKGKAEVTINPDSLWAADDRDVGRELHIAGIDYEISQVTSPTTIVLDRPVESEPDETAAYASGSMRYGTPWRIRVPTNMLVLDEEQLG